MACNGLPRSGNGDPGFQALTEILPKRDRTVHTPFVGFSAGLDQAACQLLTSWHPREHHVHLSMPAENARRVFAELSACSVSPLSWG